MNPSTNTLTDADAEVMAELLADLTWYHANRLVKVIGPAKHLGQHYKLLMACCAWDRMGLRLREAMGQHEPWEARQ